MFITALIQVHIYNSTMLKKGLYFRDRVHMDLFDFVGLFLPKICNTLCPYNFFPTVRLLIYLIEICTMFTSLRPSSGTLSLPTAFRLVCSRVELGSARLILYSKADTFQG